MLRIVHHSYARSISYRHLSCRSATDRDFTAPTQNHCSVFDVVKMLSRHFFGSTKLLQKLGLARVLLKKSSTNFVFFWSPRNCLLTHITVPVFCRAQGSLASWAAMCCKSEEDKT